MPAGSTHDRITLWSLPWIVGFTFFLTHNGELTLVIAGGFLFSGLMFGPDLDIYSRQFKRWGILRWIWIPYQKTLKHRSQLSHGLIIGTTIRIFYLLSLLILVGILGIALTQLIWGFYWNWQEFTQRSIERIINDYPQEAIALFLGLELGGMSHSLSDWIGSTYKRCKKNGWKAMIPKKKSKKKKRSRKK